MIRRHNKVELSPSYDLLNTTIIMKTQEEIALPIRGKKSKLTSNDLIEYFAIGRLNLTNQIIEDELAKFEHALNVWKNMFEISFLSKNMRKSYEELTQIRWQRLKS